VLGDGDSNLELAMKLVAELKSGLQLDASWIATLFEALAMVDVATTTMAGGHEKELESHLSYDHIFRELCIGTNGKAYLERYQNNLGFGKQGYNHDYLFL
jgi:hypothetical protein